MLTHNLAAGVVVIKNQRVLLVRDNNGWSLPKGGTEKGETFHQTAMREGLEETGFQIDVKDVAFITEYTSKEYGQYLHVYYFGEVLAESENHVLDEDIVEVRFVPSEKTRDYLKFRPWVIPLEIWLEKRCMSYHSYDLDKEDVWI